MFFEKMEKANLINGTHETNDIMLITRNVYKAVKLAVVRHTKLLSSDKMQTSKQKYNETVGPESLIVF